MGGNAFSNIIERINVYAPDKIEIIFKCDDFYHPNDEGGLYYADPEIGVEWPIPEGMELILSEKDAKWGGIKEYLKNE